jgi:hypothetical protein
MLLKLELSIVKQLPVCCVVRLRRGKEKKERKREEKRKENKKKSGNQQFGLTTELAISSWLPCG